jgi:hypothetical protein
MSRIHLLLCFVQVLVLGGLTMSTATASTEAVRLPQNLHRIDSHPRTGFALYRASEPDAADIIRFCELGITEMMVLSGNGELDHQLAQIYCPSLKVVYNVKTSARTPLTSEFLDAFDSWVMRAQTSGKRIAFRCFCGCHRTGRLAAYYQMRFMGADSQTAIQDMMDKGKVMFLYPGLDNQVRALEDYVAGRDCSENRRFCVR